MPPHYNAAQHGYRSAYTSSRPSGFALNTFAKYSRRALYCMRLKFRCTFVTYHWLLFIYIIFRWDRCWYFDTPHFILITFTRLLSPSRFITYFITTLSLSVSTAWNFGKDWCDDIIYKVTHTNATHYFRSRHEFYIYSLREPPHDISCFYIHGFYIAAHISPASFSSLMHFRFIYIPFYLLRIAYATFYRMQLPEPIVSITSLSSIYFTAGLISQMQFKLKFLVQDAIFHANVVALSTAPQWLFFSSDIWYNALDFTMSRNSLLRPRRRYVAAGLFIIFSMNISVIDVWCWFIYRDICHDKPSPLR